MGFPDIRENWSVRFYPDFFGILFVGAAAFLGQGAAFYPGCNSKEFFVGFPGLYITGSSQIIFKKGFVEFQAPKKYRSVVCVVGWTSQFLGIHSMKILSCGQPNPFFSGKLENP